MLFLHRLYLLCIFLCVVNKQQEKHLMEQMQFKSNFIFLEVKLINWQYANFTMCVRTSSAVSTIARRIHEHHGSTRHLQLFRNPPHKNNEINDFTQSLADLGFVGGRKEDGKDGILFYDFQPNQVEPLLCYEPNLYVEELDTKGRKAKAKALAALLLQEQEAAEAAAAAAKLPAPSPSSPM